MAIGTNGNGSGSVNSKTASTSLVMTLGGITGAYPAGMIAIVVIAKDNTATGADGDYSEVTGITDTGGNTYTKVAEYTNTQGSAGGGATVSIWKSKLTTTLSGGSTVTINFSASVTAKAALYDSFTVAPGADLTLVGTPGKLATDAAAVPNQTISGLASHEYLCVRAVAGESGWSASTGFNGNGEAVFSSGDSKTSGGSAVTNMGILASRQIATTTSFTLGYAPGSYSGDSAEIIVAFQETGGGGGGGAPTRNPFGYTFILG